MRCHHARRLNCGSVVGTHQLFANHSLDFFRGQPARTQQMHPVAVNLDDGGFNPDATRACIKDQVQPVAEIARDCARARRADAA